MPYKVSKLRLYERRVPDYYVKNKALLETWKSCHFDACSKPLILKSTNPKSIFDIYLLPWCYTRTRYMYILMVCVCVAYLDDECYILGQPTKVRLISEVLRYVFLEEVWKGWPQFLGYNITAPNWQKFKGNNTIILSENDKTVTDSCEVVNFFNKYFVSTASEIGSPDVIISTDDATSTHQNHAIVIKIR